MSIPSATSEPTTNDNKSARIVGYRMYKTALFNYNETTADKLRTYVESKQGGEYVIGWEICPKTQKPHLQCFVKFKNQIRWEEISKAINLEACWKPCGGKGVRKDNFIYCTKGGKYITNMNDLIVEKTMSELVLEQEYKDVSWKLWQKHIIQLLDTKPNKRWIYWFYEGQGNTGKSFLAKYLCCTKELILGEGKRLDVYNQVLAFIKDKKKGPELIILDIPRDSMEFVNYASIEQLKNGCLYSGKYEGGQCVFPIPHVIIFSNLLPNTLSLSLDRWKIFEISNEELKEIKLNDKGFVINYD